MRAFIKALFKATVSLFRPTPAASSGRMPSDVTLEAVLSAPSHQMLGWLEECFGPLGCCNSIAPLEVFSQMQGLGYKYSLEAGDRQGCGRCWFYKEGADLDRQILVSFEPLSDAILRSALLALCMEQEPVPKKVSARERAEVTFRVAEVLEQEPGLRIMTPDVRKKDGTVIMAVAPHTTRTDFSLHSNEALAVELADELLGHGRKPCNRVVLMTGIWPNDKAAGGLCRDALVEVFLEVLNRKH